MASTAPPERYPVNRVDPKSADAALSGRSRRDAIANHRGSAGPVPQTFDALLFESPGPDIELGTRNPKEPAGLGDVLTDLLVVLKHAQVVGANFVCLAEQAVKVDPSDTLLQVVGELRGAGKPKQF